MVVPLKKANNPSSPYKCSELAHIRTKSRFGVSCFFSIGVADTCDLKGEDIWLEQRISCGSFFLFHFDRVMENSCVLLLSSAVIIPMLCPPLSLKTCCSCGSLKHYKCYTVVRDKLVGVFDPLLNARTSNVSDFVFDCHAKCRGKSY